MSFTVVEWPKSTFAGGFSAVCGLTAVLSMLGMPVLWLRLVRLAAGGAATVTGAILTIQLGWAVDHPEVGDPQDLSGALLLALVLAGVGVWVSDMRITKAADDAAAREHREVLDAIAAMSGQCPADGAGRRAWVPWLIVAAVAVRRRR